MAIIRQIAYEFLFAFHCKCPYHVPLLRYSASTIGVTLKYELGVVQGR